MADPGPSKRRVTPTFLSATTHRSTFDEGLDPELVSQFDGGRGGRSKTAVEAVAASYAHRFGHGAEFDMDSPVEVQPVVWSDDLTCEERATSLYEERVREEIMKRVLANKPSRLKLKDHAMRAYAKGMEKKRGEAFANFSHRDKTLYTRTMTEVPFAERVLDFDYWCPAIDEVIPSDESESESEESEEAEVWGGSSRRSAPPSLLRHYARSVSASSDGRSPARSGRSGTRRKPFSRPQTLEEALGRLSMRANAAKAAAVSPDSIMEDAMAPQAGRSPVAPSPMLGAAAAAAARWSPPPSVAADEAEDTQSMLRELARERMRREGRFAEAQRGERAPGPESGLGPALALAFSRARAISAAK